MSPSVTATAPPPFDTYSQYLESIIKERPEYTSELTPFVRYLHEMYNKENYLTQASTIIDISAQATTALTVQHFGFDQDEHRPAASAWPKDFSAALGAVEDGTHTRVVLVDAASKSLDPVLIDIIGLRFDVEPRFFWFHLQSPGFLEQTNRLRGLRLPPSPIGVPFLHLGVRVNTSIFILEKYAIRGSKVNVVLALTDRISRKEMWNAAGLGINSPPGPQLMKRNVTLTSSPARTDEVGVFEDLILSLPHRKIVAAQQNPVLYIFPLIRLQTAWFEASTLAPRAAYSRRNSKLWVSSDSNEDLHALWENLRFSMEVFETSFSNFLHFVSHWSSLAAHPGVLDKDVAEISRCKEAVLQEAQRLDSAIRDTLQLQVGILALLESRRSIEQSKIAIEEGRRVKLLTVLAFVFVPVSLASSIFGMNVQQINHTGTNIWVFIVTAVLLTTTAFFLWGFSSFFVKARKQWQRRPSERIPWRKRLALIWRLARNGHFVWMVRYGALLGLVTNGRNGYKSKRKGFEDGPYMHIKKHFPLNNGIFTPKSSGSSA
ncbi:MAG: hypothetical protein M1836_006013 [Candelina mexicana]|nr:MAG: hypothetical protein M1836_006013 [Candelina mexicana]